VVCGDRRASYGSLADAAAKLPQPEKVDLKPPEKWTVIGQPTRRLDSPEKITGRAKFGIDVQFPGLLTAVVAHAPTFGGKVKSFDASAAKAVPGVKAVVEVPSGVAVVAEHFWAAKKGRDALEVQWDLGPHAKLDTTELRQSYRETAKSAGAKASEAGDAEKALAEKSVTAPVVAEYSLPYLAHAPMEPLNCTVKPGSDGCEVWTGTQFQTVDQQRVAQIFGLKPDQVKINTTFLGGGFGRRANIASDFVVEAAHVAKAANSPVKVVWTREDDIAAATTVPWPSTGSKGRWTATAAPPPGAIGSSRSPSWRARRSPA
jgi:isoquinoline 1-oxidoreductase subunit beta